jgi:hypothetical protein
MRTSAGTSLHNSVLQHAREVIKHIHSVVVQSDSEGPKKDTMQFLGKVCITVIFTLEVSAMTPEQSTHMFGITAQVWQSVAAAWSRAHVAEHQGMRSHPHQSPHYRMRSGQEDGYPALGFRIETGNGVAVLQAWLFLE